MKKINLLKNANPFVFSGGIGRVTYLLSLIGLFILSFILIGIGFLISVNYSLPTIQIIIKIYSIFCLIILCYMIFLCYMKRLHDIINDKRKSIVYIITLYITYNCLEFMPSAFANILGKIIIAGAIIGLLLIPGKEQNAE